MTATRVLDGLSTELRDRLDRALQRGSLPRSDLDALLAAFAEPSFEAGCEELIERLGTTPLDLHDLDDAAQRERTSHALPGGGRISRGYLHELDRFPTMTREEEVAGARRLEFALERVAAAEFQPRATLCARRLEYSRLFNDFVERNLHIVVSEVYGYRTYDVPLDDLVQEGNAALMHAVEKFDWRKGVRFRTYVVWWIKQAVERHLASVKGAVRVPHHLQQRLRRLKRQGTLPRGFDGATSIGEVAKAFEVDHDQASHLVEASRASVSLDAESNERGGAWRDLLAESWEPTDSSRDATLRGRIGQLLGTLDEREQTVLRLRFGLEGGAARTLEEIGEVLHLSRERSRQIQQSALGKLRASAAARSLENEI